VLGPSSNKGTRDIHRHVVERYDSDFARQALAIVQKSGLVCFPSACSSAVASLAHCDENRLVCISAVLGNSVWGGWCRASKMFAWALRMISKAFMRRLRSPAARLRRSMQDGAWCNRRYAAPWRSRLAAP
jgi:hypothetical protein